MQIVNGIFSVPSVVAHVYVLVDTDGLSLVDTGLPYNHKRILQYVSQLGFAPEQVRRLLVTHADRDHVGSVAALQARTGARVLASRLEGDALAAGRETRRLRLKSWQRPVFRLLRPLFAKLTPGRADEVIEDGDLLPVLGGLRVLATPGHTPGHLSFFAEQRGVLFAGDSLRVVGARLRVSSGPNTHDAAAAQQSARRQLALRPQVICAGHGPAVFGAYNTFAEERL
jgi:glyoxylase-like metal-dependent hydrolase (beta-lactamase superfamily II)